MPPTTEASSWDFTPVIDLLHSFSADSHSCRHDVNSDLLPANHRVSSVKQLENDDTTHREDCAPSLGDFSSVWTFLSQSPSVAKNGAPPESASKLEDESLRRDSASERVVNGDVAVNGVEDLYLQNPPLGKNAQKHINSASVLSRSSGVGISKGKLHNLQEPSEHAQPAIKILTRSVPPQELKVKPNDPPLPKNSCAVYSKSCVTLEKRPRSPTKKKPGNGSVSTSSVAEKREKLVKKLIGNFPKQQKLLANSEELLPTCSPQDASADAIHVFVDASNIMIGFHDRIKVSRNIPVTTRIPRVPLSFHNFSLVLERGRQVTKRVLVGSDRFPAIKEAERIGYEANILDRVHKSKEFTPGRKKFRNGKNGHSNGNANGKGNGNGNGNSHCNGFTGQSGSGSETNAAPVREKWVEQAVDEILHLKILESIVDTEEPSTMVLATGDAAEAEYSGGFMKMVTRALQKGWTIELVSFSLNTSATYKRKEFRSKWGSKFKMIELDGYIDELIDTS